MSVVRPEFGPTLPELLRPRLRGLPRPVRAALALAGVAVVAVIAWALLRGEPGVQTVVVREPLAFNFIYRAPLERVTPTDGALAALAAQGQSFTVRPLRLPAYAGDSAGFLPLYAGRVAAQLGTQLPDFAWRQEGRANINRVQGYELDYQFRRDGTLVYGRRIWLLPEATAREGLELRLEAPRSTTIPAFDSVGRNGALKTALRSFRLGTERP